MKAFLLALCLSVVAIQIKANDVCDMFQAELSIVQDQMKSMEEDLATCRKLAATAADEKNKTTDEKMLRLIKSVNKQADLMSHSITQISLRKECACEGFDFNLVNQKIVEIKYLIKKVQSVDLAKQKADQYAAFKTKTEKLWTVLTEFAKYIYDPCKTPKPAAPEPEEPEEEPVAENTEEIEEVATDTTTTEPEPIAEVIEEPTTPTPTPTPEPTPEPITDTTSTPDPVEEEIAEVPEEEPTPEPEPIPTPEPVVEKDTIPSPEPAPEPEPEPIPEPVEEPITEIIQDTVPEPEPAPEPEPETEEIAEVPVEEPAPDPEPIEAPEPTPTPEPEIKTPPTPPASPVVTTPTPKPEPKPTPAPKPTTPKITPTESVYFAVQVAAGADANPPKSIAGLNEDFYIYEEGGLNKFRVGRYQDLNEAINAKNRIFKKGVTDAFIVAYADGQRVGVSEAKAKLRGTVPAATSSPIVAQSRGKSKPTSKIKKRATVYLAVQVGASVSATDPIYELAKYEHQLQMKVKAIQSSPIRYYTGETTDQNTAEQTLSLVKSKGVENAFLIGIADGERVVYQDALNFLQGK